MLNLEEHNEAWEQERLERDREWYHEKFWLEMDLAEEERENNVQSSTEIRTDRGAGQIAILSSTETKTSA